MRTQQTQLPGHCEEAEHALHKQCGGLLVPCCERQAFVSKKVLVAGIEE